MPDRVTEVVEQPQRNTAPVQIPADIVRMTRVVLAHRGWNAAEFLGPMVRNKVAAEYRKVLAELNQSADLGGEG